MKFPAMKLSVKLNLISSVASFLESQAEYCVNESADYLKRSKESEGGDIEYYEIESNDYKIRSEIYNYLLSKLSEL